MMQEHSIFVIDHLRKYYGGSSLFSTLLGLKKHHSLAVDDVSLSIRQGEVLGIVGESGCGKSTLGWSLCKLLKPSGGGISYCGRDLWRFSESEDRAFHQECQIILQNPDSSLNPRKTVEKIIERPLILFNHGTSREREQRVLELLSMVNMETRYAKAYPHELSGGEKQRVAVARAFSANPKCVVCDEPLSALDVSVQASIINLLIDLRRRFGTTYAFISHDLSVVKYISDSVCVLYLGKICEIGSTEEVFLHASHPYTRALLSAVPRIEVNHQEEIIRLEGAVPSAKNPPNGCRFHTRCREKIVNVCDREEPRATDLAGGHRVYCHLFDKYQ